MDRPARFAILQCTNQLCRFRLPVEKESINTTHCPKCASEFDVHEWIDGSVSPSTGNLQGELLRIEVLLDNLRSAYNVGSIIRTADGVGIEHLYLCGITPTPDHRQVSKTSLGAEKNIDWSSHNNAFDVAIDLLNRGRTLWALESMRSAESLFCVRQSNPARPVVLVVGNERSGIDPAILEISETVISIPMFGEKSSLNVVVAFGIAAYFLRFRVKNQQQL